MRSWRGPVVTEQGNPGIYVQIDEWIPLYKGNVYVVDEVTGRMYLSKKSHLMRIPETASHRPLEDHELSMSQHIPERETDVVSRTGGKQELQYPQEPIPEWEDRPGEIIDRTPDPTMGATSRAVSEAQRLEDTVTEDTVVPCPPVPERELQQSREVWGEEVTEPSFSLPPPVSHLTPPRPPRQTEPQDRPHQMETPGQMGEMTASQAERVRMRKLAALAIQQILKLRRQRDMLEEQLVQEFHDRREHRDLT